MKHRPVRREQRTPPVYTPLGTFAIVLVWVGVFAVIALVLLLAAISPDGYEAQGANPGLGRCDGCPCYPGVEPGVYCSIFCPCRWGDLPTPTPVPPTATPEPEHDLPAIYVVPKRRIALKGSTFIESFYMDNITDAMTFESRLFFNPTILEARQLNTQVDCDLYHKTRLDNGFVRFDCESSLVIPSGKLFDVLFAAKVGGVAYLQPWAFIGAESGAGYLPYPGLFGQELEIITATVKVIP